MYKNALVAFLVLLSTSLVSSPSRGDSIRYVAVNIDPYFLGAVPACKPFPPGRTMVQIYLDLTAPAQGFRFTGPSGDELDAISWEYGVVGDQGATQTLDFGGCLDGSILLGTALYDVEGVACQGLIAGDAVSTGRVLPTVVGCDDVERFAETPCDAAQPTLLSPADAAANVPLIPTLTWQSGVGEFCVEGIGVYNFSLYFGTSPETLTYVDTGLPEFTEWQFPDPLLPETTYYWRVRVTDDYWNYVGANIRFSPMHRFTTGAPVAVQGISWSTFKRVYRE